jgi:hypothetical protein
MNFNDFVNTVAESTEMTSEELESRAPNPQFQAWKQAQDPAFISTLKNPYTYWYLKVKNKGDPVSTSTPAASPTPAPAAVPTAPKSNSELKTRAAIEDYLSGNPNATTEEIVAHLNTLNDPGVDIKTQYVTSPDEVERMRSEISSETQPPVSDTEEAPDKVEKAMNATLQAKYNKLREFLKKSPQERRAYLDNISKARAAQAAELPGEENDEEEAEPEIDPDVERYRRSMVGDETEEEPEFDDNQND